MKAKSEAMGAVVEAAEAWHHPPQGRQADRSDLLAAGAQAGSEDPSVWACHQVVSGVVVMSGSGLTGAIGAKHEQISRSWCKGVGGAKQKAGRVCSTRRVGRDCCSCLAMR
jgi:hypothetical protein